MAAPKAQGHVDGFWAPTCPPRSVIPVSTNLYFFALGALLGPRWPQEPPRNPKTGSKTYFRPMLDDFCDLFDRFLVDSLNDFWLIFLSTLMCCCVGLLVVWLLTWRFCLPRCWLLGFSIPGMVAEMARRATGCFDPQNINLQVRTVILTNWQLQETDF